ncbi:neuferricin-like [Oratosquilla oratoria]|uniref:neuferricin-like n=1 Tax=Oratosquilla oratoria TaxID=337810 RepID=UPI003F767D59
MGHVKKLCITAVVTVVTALLIKQYVPPEQLQSFMNDPGKTSIAAANFVYKETVKTLKRFGFEKVKPRKKERLFTVEELKTYDGKKSNKGPYLAVMGRVYNVKKGAKHYGPGGGYGFFSGRDASRAFVSGDFSEAGLVDNIEGLSVTDYIGLDEWVKFYDADYKYVGKLIGRYYDENGEPTEYYSKAQQWIGEAYRKRERENDKKKLFPHCNSAWTAESGSRVWCTLRSGGVERDWVGVPRLFYDSTLVKPRCACVKTTGPPSDNPSVQNHKDRGDLDNPNLREYEGCDPTSPECDVKDSD